MEIVFLETISLGDDINLDRFDELGHVTKYRDTGGTGAGAGKRCRCCCDQQNSDE